jgi:hypothetical protein
MIFRGNKQNMDDSKKLISREKKEIYNVDYKVGNC